MSGTLMLVIGNCNYSSWSLRPWILARHLGIDLAIRRIALDTPTFAADVRVFSPTGRVPVLVDGAHVIPESIAIMEYLSEMADGRGWPKDRGRRAQGRALAAEMHSGFAALRRAYPMNIRARHRHVAMTTALSADIARLNEIFTADREKEGEDGWLFGSYTITDAMFLPVALRFQTYGTAGLSERACAYVERASTDPLLREWVDAACAETEVIEHEEVGR